MENNALIEDIISSKGFFLQTTVGNSMEPLFYNRKSLVLIKKNEGILKKYDVSLFKRPTGEYVLHRVVKVNKKKEYYYIVGDNRIKKEKVPFSWVIGVMDGYYKGENYISVNDKEYKKYVRNLIIFYPFRMIKLILKRIFK